MIMEELLHYLNAIYPLSNALQHHLASILKTKNIPRKGILLKAGHVCRSIYFIEKGMLRCFYVNNGNEVCSWFMNEGNLIVSVESFFMQKESYESIQALEDSTLLYIEYTELQHVYHTFPEFNFIARVLTEKYYMLSEQRLYSLRMQRASDRYAYLMENFPEIIQRVPSKYIASYLGITEVTLSNIKSKRIIY